MELKTYQSQVIQDLRQYLATLADTPHLENAFRDYWAERGVTGMPAYKNTIPGVPHVCAKVPTAGGKTYIAVNALQPIFDALSAINPQRPKFVVWLVPSLTILEQTARNLSNPDHPYHKRLSQLFKGRVAIYRCGWFGCFGHWWGLSVHDRVGPAINGQKSIIPDKIVSP